MSSNLQNVEALVFLYACLQSTDSKIDFDTVAYAFDTTVDAVRARFDSIKKDIEAKIPSGAPVLEPSTTGAQGTKRKATDDVDHTGDTTETDEDLPERIAAIYRREAREAITSGGSRAKKGKVADNDVPRGGRRD